jgi:hypothetical protein
VHLYLLATSTELAAVQMLPATFDPIVVSATAGLSKSSPPMSKPRWCCVASKRAAPSSLTTIARTSRRLPLAISSSIHFDEMENDVEALRRTLRVSFGRLPLWGRLLWVEAV